MDTNDFIGSFAQENIDFTTRIVKTSSVGQNYWTTMIFTEKKRYITADDSALESIKGLDGVKVLEVNADTYAEYTKGLLRSWLYDLFCNGNTNSCYLIICGDISTADDVTSFIANMEAAYAKLKAHAYHKTACVMNIDNATGGDNPTYTPVDDSDLELNTDVLVALAKLMKEDYEYLSGTILLPFATQTPEEYAEDKVYAAFIAAGTDAFLSAHQDTSRNASLYSLGLALSQTNGSGTCVGNNMDMWASSNITSSGADGGTLDRAIRKILNGQKIQTWKPVGNNTGDVAAENAQTLRGNVYQAIWMKAYITYMVKIGIAEILTQPNMLRNGATYALCCEVLLKYLAKFITSGRLADVETNLPSFSELPESDAEITIENAWTGTYVDQVRKVSISGTLYIGADVGLAA